MFKVLEEGLRILPVSAIWKRLNVAEMTNESGTDIVHVQLLPFGGPLLISIFPQVDVKSCLVPHPESPLPRPHTV